MFCYKLVRYCFGDYVSINTCVQLNYTIGKVTKPDVGRIYVYESIEDANRAYNKHNYVKILWCECSRIRHVPAIMTAFDKHDVCELFHRDRVSHGKLRQRLCTKEWVMPLSDKLATVSWLRPVEVVQ